MDHVTNYIFGSLKDSENAVKFLFRQLKKTNHKVKVLTIATMIYITLINIKDIQQDKKIKELERKIKELEND